LRIRINNNSTISYIEGGYIISLGAKPRPDISRADKLRVDLAHEIAHTELPIPNGYGWNCLETVSCEIAAWILAVRGLSPINESEFHYIEHCIGSYTHALGNEESVRIMLEEYIRPCVKRE